MSPSAAVAEASRGVEFIHVLPEQCLKFILASGGVTLEDVCDFVKQSHVDLGQEEVLQIVNTLVYDGEVDAHDELELDKERDPDDPAGEHGGDVDDDSVENVIVVYRPASLPIPKSSAFTAVPCGVCPVFQECAPGGLVSPETCQYMQDWLSF